MATAVECEHALRTLADRLDAAREGGATHAFDDLERTLSCSIRDLDVVFGARLRHGRLSGIAPAPSARAQIRLDVGSDDLLHLIDGSLPFAGAWLGGRVKVNAGVRDLMRLRALF